MIDCTAWAPTREVAIAFLKAIDIAKLDTKTGDIIATADVVIHPFRTSETISIEATPAVFNPDGTVITPAVMVDGFHFNLRFYGSSEATLVAGRSQVDANGQTLGLFLRTRILELVYFRTNEVPQWAATKLPVPPGYETPEGVRCFDPDTIKNRRNVFA